MKKIKLISSNYRFGQVETIAESLVLECRNRWEELNKTKKNNSKIGDIPYLKFGCDDITTVVCYLNFIEEDQL